MTEELEKRIASLEVCEFCSSDDLNFEWKNLNQKCFENAWIIE